MSVHLDALSDEVFSAAAAQARGAARVDRFPYGEVRRSSEYPHLFFLNGITDLRAPGWTVEDLERALADSLPGIVNARVLSRDPQTIAHLGPRLVEAGYQAECRVAMVEVAASELPLNPSVKTRPVEMPDDWRSLAALMRQAAAEHGWTQSMAEELVRLLQGKDEPQQSWLLASVGDEAVGYLGLYQHGTVGYLPVLYTRRSSRRLGVGSALVLETSRRARAMGCDRLTLHCTRDSFLPGFYHRLGFRSVGEMWLWTRPAVA